MRSYCNLIFFDFSRTVLEFDTILCCTIFNWLVSYQEGSGVYESNRGTAQRAQVRNDGKMLWLLCRKRADRHGNQGFGSSVRLHYGKSLFVFQQCRWADHRINGILHGKGRGRLYGDGAHRPQGCCPVCERGPVLDSQKNTAKNIGWCIRYTHIRNI